MNFIPLQNIDLSHTQNLTQGLGLNSLSSSILSNASILNQPQQHQMPSMQSQSHSHHQSHHAIPQVPTSQQQSHTNGAHSGTNSNNMIQTSTANSTSQAQNLTSNSNDTNTFNGANANGNGNGISSNNASKATSTTTKKKKKKKPPKEKKPRPKPGEIRLTTALDGSTLYGCPECHMVYPGEYQNVLHWEKQTNNCDFVTFYYYFRTRTT